jgi:nitroreductase
MIVKEISNRRSIKKYKAETVPEEYITEIIRAAQFAPSAMNNHAIELKVADYDPPCPIFLK